MAARDRFTYEIECTKCGQKGVLHISEDDHPYMRNPHRAIDKIEGEFKTTLTGGIDVSITCGKCNNNFTY